MTHPFDEFVAWSKKHQKDIDAFRRAAEDSLNKDIFEPFGVKIKFVPLDKPKWPEVPRMKLKIKKKKDLNG